MSQKLYTAIARRWFDKVNGNTYHSVRITRHSDGAVITVPFTYGYGDFYRQSALRAMLDAGWIAGDTLAVWKYERDNNYPIIWDVSDGLKRDCVANGKTEE